MKRFRFPKIPEKAEKKIVPVLMALFLLIFLFIVSFFVQDKLRHHRSPLIESSYTTLEGFETVTKTNRFSVEFPCTLKAAPGEYYVLETTLPAVIEDNTWIDYYTGRNSRILINGVVREIFDRDHNTVIGGTVKGIHLFVKLTPEDAGKVLRIERLADGDGSGYFRPVYIGDSLAMTERMMRSEGPYFVFTFTLLIVSLIAIAIGILLKFYKKLHSPITAVGLGTFLASLWLIFDSELFAFAFRDYYIDGTMSFLVMPLIPGPFLYYLNMLQKDRYKQPFIYLGAFLELSTVCFYVIHFSGLMNFLSMMPFMMIALGIVIAGAVLSLILDLIRGYYREYRISFIGLMGFIALSILEIVLILTVEERHDGSMIILGLYWTLVLGILHQLYEVREAQKETQMAIRASETKSNFLANMSHEIRTPMNAILGMDEMILREAKGNEKVMKYASDIKSAGNILLAIINDILDLSKIESGKAELVNTDFDLSSVINDLINITRMRAYDKGLNYRMDIVETIPAKYYGDEIRVRQVMVNVINNAIKYTKEGEVQIRVRFDRGETDTEGTLVVSVKDTGVGIREEDIPYLFEAFGRLEQTKNRNIEGTGLGLNIANSYIRMMGGRIDVQSTYGKGSEFTLYIPLIIRDNRPIGDFAQAIHRIDSQRNQYIPVIKAPNARVLVVDDNEMNLEVICGLMETTSIRVDTALSGAAAIEQMKKKHYDLIYLDQMMPEMDGVTTLQNMRAQFDLRGVAVIALTADAVAGAREFYLEKGFDDYVSKPIRAEDLERSLLNHLPKQLLVAVEKPVVTEEDAAPGSVPSYDFSALEALGVDASVGEDYTGSREKYLSALQRFYHSSEGNLLKIREYHESNDLENLSIVVHALKSNAKMIGAADLSGMFETLEHASKKGEASEVEEMLPEAITKYRELLKALKPLADTADLTAAGELDAEEAKAVASQLLTALDDFDDALSAELAGKLSGYPFRINQKNKLREAADYIREYMYDEAADLIREIIAAIE